MTTQQKRHVVVVGAGFVGLATARALQKTQSLVTLIDPHTPGSGSSYGNAGLIAGGGIASAAVPGFWKALPKMLWGDDAPLRVRWQYLPQTFAYFRKALRASQAARFEASAKAIASLSIDAFDQWLDLLDDTADGRALFTRSGTILLHLSEQERARAERMNDLQAQHGMTVRDLDEHSVREQLPGFEGAIAGATLFENAGFVALPARLSQVLTEQISGSGGQFISASAKDFATGPNGVRAVITDDGSVDCDAVVLAAGAFSKPLTAALGVNLPLDTERGYHVHFCDADLGIQRPFLVPSRGFAITPMSNGARIAGLVEFGGLQAPPSSACIDTLKRYAIEHFPDLHGQQIETWLGFRPSLPDGLPVIGQVPNHPNAFVAFGHGHRGLTQAAATAHLITSLINRTPPTISPEPFQLSRYLVP